MENFEFHPKPYSALSPCNSPDDNSCDNIDTCEPSSSLIDIRKMPGQRKNKSKMSKKTKLGRPKGKKMILNESITITDIDKGVKTSNSNSLPKSNLNPSIVSSASNQINLLPLPLDRVVEPVILNGNDSDVSVDICRNFKHFVKYSALENSTTLHTSVSEPNQISKESNSNLTDSIQTSDHNTEEHTNNSLNIVPPLQSPNRTYSPTITRDYCPILENLITSLDEIDTNTNKPTDQPIYVNNNTKSPILENCPSVENIYPNINELCPTFDKPSLNEISSTIDQLIPPIDIQFPSINIPVMTHDSTSFNSPGFFPNTPESSISLDSSPSHFNTPNYTASPLPDQCSLPLNLNDYSIPIISNSDISNDIVNRSFNKVIDSSLINNNQEFLSPQDNVESLIVNSTSVTLEDINQISQTNQSENSSKVISNKKLHKENLIYANAFNNLINKSLKNKEFKNRRQSDDSYSDVSICNNSVDEKSFDILLNEENSMQYLISDDDSLNNSNEINKLQTKNIKKKSKRILRKTKKGVRSPNKLVKKSKKIMKITSKIVNISDEQVIKPEKLIKKLAKNTSSEDNLIIKTDKCKKKDTLVYATKLSKLIDTSLTSALDYNPYKIEKKKSKSSYTLNKSSSSSISFQNIDNCENGNLMDAPVDVSEKKPVTKVSNNRNSPSFKNCSSVLNNNSSHKYLPILNLHTPKKEKCKNSANKNISQYKKNKLNNSSNTLNLFNQNITNDSSDSSDSSCIEDIQSKLINQMDGNVDDTSATEDSDDPFSFGTSVTPSFNPFDKSLNSSVNPLGQSLNKTSQQKSYPSSSFDKVATPSMISYNNDDLSTPKLLETSFTTNAQSISIEPASTILDCISNNTDNNSHIKTKTFEEVSIKYRSNEDKEICKRDIDELKCSDIDDNLKNIGSDHKLSLHQSENNENVKHNKQLEQGNIIDNSIPVISNEFMTLENENECSSDNTADVEEYINDSLIIPEKIKKVVPTIIPKPKATRTINNLSEIQCKTIDLNNIAYFLRCINQDFFEKMKSIIPLIKKYRNFNLDLLVS